MSIIIFLLILFFLVLVHEFGHFIIAKKNGVRVDEFAIGFPPRIWSKKIGETIYSLNILPLGGFVKIFGENPDEESINGKDKERSLVHKSKFIQAFVLVAGVLMNVIFAWFLFIIAILIGLPIPGGYAGDKPLLNSEVMIVSVLPNSPAEISGIKSGDKIIGIEDGVNSISAKNLKEVQDFIGNRGDHTLKLELKNSEGVREIEATPKAGLTENRAALGIELAESGILKLSLFPAITEAFKITIYLLGAIFLGLIAIIKGVFLGSADINSLTGPVGIVGMVGDATKIGFAYLLSFAAMISANLAVLNLLPFPALDGGRLLFVIIEGIIRRPIKPKIANAINVAGFALLMVLMVVVTYHDIVKLF